MLSNLVEIPIGRCSFSFQILSAFYFEHSKEMKISLRSTSILFTCQQHVDINCQNVLSLEAKTHLKKLGNFPLRKVSLRVFCSHGYSLDIHVQLSLFKTLNPVK